VGENINPKSNAPKIMISRTYVTKITLNMPAPPPPPPPPGEGGV